MMKNLQGILSPSKKKRTFQTDQSIAVKNNDPQDPTGAGPINNNTPEKTSRLMRMNVLKTPPRLTDDNDAKESSPGVLARRRKSSKGEELSFSPSFEEAKAGITGNIRGFFNRRKSATATTKSEEAVLSPAESNGMYEDSEIEDSERSYLEEIFKRKQAAMHSNGQEDEEPSEQQFSSADNNNSIAAENKSRRGRRRSVTRLISESRKREVEKGNFSRGESPVTSDNHSRRRRRSVHARPYEDSPKETNDLQSHSVRLRRSSVPSVEDNDKVDVTDRRTRRGRRSMIEENKGNRNGHEDERQARRNSRAVGDIDDKNDLVANDRSSRQGQRIIQDIVDKHSSEDKRDRKSRRTHSSLEIRDGGDAQSKGDAHSHSRNRDSDKQRRATSRPRNRSRGPISGSRNRSRSLSKNRNRDQSPTRKRSKSRRRASEVQVTRERRRSRSRHRPSLASLKKDDDDGHRGHGTDRDINTIRERDNADRNKNRDLDTRKEREGHREKERDRRRGRDRGVDRERRSNGQVSERGFHVNVSEVEESRSRRKATNDDHSSAHSYLSDSASTFDSFMHQSKAENSFNSADEGSRGAHATAKVRVPTSRGSMSKSKNKLTSYLPSDERVRLKHILEMKSPLSKEKKNKQNVEERQSKIEAVTSRRGTGDKSAKPKTGRDLPGEGVGSRENVRDESFSEETNAFVSNNNRFMAKKENVVMYESEEVHDDTQEITDPATSPGERRSRSRRVALTSVLESDIGGEREADILSLSPAPKPTALDPDRDGKSGSSSFSGFRPDEYDSGRNLKASEQSKVSDSFENINIPKIGTSVKGGASSSTLKDEVSYNLKSSQIIKDLESSPTEVDTLTAVSEVFNGIDRNSGVDVRQTAAKNGRLDLPVESGEDKAIAKVALRRDVSGNGGMFHSDMDTAASNRKTKDIKHQDLIQISREQRLVLKEARRGRDVSPAELAQDSVLVSPISRRSHDHSRKSVKGVSKRGDKYSRTKPHNSDHHDNSVSSRKRSLSPPRTKPRNRQLKDESSHDSKLSTWRPPRIKERAADTNERTSHMRRRGSSHRMEGPCELNDNDAALVEYDEQDVFTLYSWSGNRQSEDRIQRERLALKNSIRALSLFRAYENVEPT